MLGPTHVPPSAALKFSRPSPRGSLVAQHYKGITSPPKDPNKWAAFITQIVAGLVSRYGLDEVRSWRFEGNGPSSLSSPSTRNKSSIPQPNAALFAHPCCARAPSLE